MSILQIIQYALGTIASLGILSLAVGYLYAQFSRGKSERGKSEIENENTLVVYLKNQIGGFKEIIENQDKKIVELGKEIASFRAVIEEKDKTITKYLEILQNRNPALENFIDKVGKTADNAEAFMKENRENSKQVSDILLEIKKFMEGVNLHLEQDMEIKGTITAQHKT